MNLPNSPSQDAADGVAAGSNADRQVAVEPLEEFPETPASIGDGQEHFVPGRLLVKFRNVPPGQVQQALAELESTDTGEIPGIGVKIVQLPANANEQAHLNAFRGRPDVEFAERDQNLRPQVNPNDPYFTNQWHLSKIAAPTAWDSTVGSNSVTIAIIDTGVNAHPDLSTKMVPGWNFKENNADTSDPYGHGTAVAGVAAAATNNANGVAGVSWGSLIMPIRVSGADGYGSTSAMANGLVWAADRCARVANVNYQVSTSSTITTAAQYFRNRGGVVVIPAGNDTRVLTSADNPYVLTISSTSSTDSLATWTNTGNLIDLCAPGVSVRTTNPNGGYGSWSGTCFSTANVSGVAALVISANPNLTASQIEQVLKSNADDLGPAGWDPGYGAGRLNASRAVLAAGGTLPGDSTPPSVSFTSPQSGETVAGTVQVQIGASDNLGVASVSFYVNGSLQGTATAAPYNFSWNVSQLANGAYALSATATDAAGNPGTAQINVTVINPPDMTPPTVSITSPAPNTLVRGNVNVAVSASDNVGVTRVELYVDGVLKATSTAAPFTTKFNANSLSSGNHVLQTKAYDQADNVGMSAQVTVRK